MGYQKPVITGKVNKLRRSEVTIKEVLKERRDATKYGITAIVCFDVMLWASHSAYSRVVAHSYWAFLPGTIGFFSGWAMIGFILLCRMQFLSAYMGFYLRRYIDALETLEAEGYDWTKIADKNALNYWEFYWAKDLKQFERSLFDYLRSFRRAEDLLRRQAKWAATNTKLACQLKVVLDKFQITGTERQEILDDFSSYDNPQRRKEFLNGFRSRTAHKRWVELQGFAKAEGPSGFPLFPPDLANLLNEEDFRIRYLEAEASKVTSDSARQYYREGLDVISRRDKIRLFKRALSEDVRSAETNGEVLAMIAMTSKTPSKTALNVVKHLSLQDFARERLIDLSQFATETDWQMCREVVLALARPGQSGGRFNKHYFAEDTVKRMVRRQCNMYGDFLFKPTAFDEAVSWLLKNGVLVTKPKVDERTLSLSTNVKNATPAGAHIISMILRLKREMSGLPS